MVNLEALRMNRNYTRGIYLPENCKQELKWWLTEGLFSSKIISQGKPDLIIQTDASGTGWGALLLNKK